MSPALQSAGVDPVLVVLFLAVVLGALVMVVRARRAPAPVEEEAPPDAFVPRRAADPDGPAPASADPAVELERIAIRRLRVVEEPARDWTDDVGVLEAWWVLGRAAPVPPGREALAAAVHAARQGAVVLADLDASVSVQVEALYAHRDPGAVWAWEAALGVVPGVPLLRALARTDPARARAALRAVPTPRLVLGEMVCAGRDAGRVDEALEAAWISGEADAWAGDDRAWLGLELRRLARVDPDRARGLYERLAEEGPLPAAVLVDYHRLGVWPASGAAEASPIERAARLLALLGRGEDVRSALPPLRAAVGEGDEPDQELFALLLRIDLKRVDPEGLAETLRVAGPTGWQVTAAAMETLRQVPEERRRPLLAVLQRPVAPGPLARSAGAPPAWLSARQPGAIDVLALFSAMGADGPWWWGAPAE